MRHSVFIGLFFLILFISCKRNNENHFAIRTVNGEEMRMDDFKNKISVFIFLSTSCPLSKSYTKTISSLKEKYAQHGIEFYGVYPFHEDNEDSVKIFTSMYNLNITSVLDHQKKLTKLLSARITPQVVVFNKNEILYSGRIDNWATSVREKRQVITSHDLDEALTAILNNKPITNKFTEPIGCIIE